MFLYLIYRNEVALRLLVDSDLEEVAELWGLDVQTLTFLCDSRLCSNRNYVAVYRNELIGKVRNSKTYI